jgi:hypothetical protein
MVIRLEPKGVLIFAIQKSDYFFYFEIATPAYGGLAMTAKLIFLARDEEAFALLSLRAFRKGGVAVSIPSVIARALLWRARGNLFLAFLNGIESIHCPLVESVSSLT